MTAETCGAAKIGLVGFRWDENSSLLRGTADAPPLIRSAFAGADVVEFNPKVDSSGLTAMVCAKLVKELAGKMLASD